MPTPVEVLVTVDATGAIQGSQQAADAINAAITKINNSSTRLGNETRKASGFLERFGDAPKRNIGVLDALNSTIIQATGGFQALGPASAAAATGLRASLFAVSSFLGPIGTITLALGALAAVFALVRKEAEQNVRAININIDAVKALAESTDALAASARAYINIKIAEKEAEIVRLKFLYDELAKSSKGAMGTTVGLAEAQANLTAQIATLRGGLTELNKDITKVRREYEGFNKVLELAGEHQKLIDETNRHNLKIATQERLEATRKAEAEQKRILEATKRAAEELQQFLASNISSALVNAFSTGFQNIGQMFQDLLAQLAKRWLESELLKLVGSFGLGGGLGFLGPLALVGSFLGGLLHLGGGSGGRSHYGDQDVSSGGGYLSYRPSTMSSSGGGGNTTVIVNALDTKTLLRAVHEEVIPIIERASLTRRTRIATT